MHTLLLCVATSFCSDPLDALEPYSSQSTLPRGVRVMIEDGDEMQKHDQTKLMAQDGSHDGQRLGIVLSSNPATTCYTIKLDHTGDVVQVGPNCVTPCVVFRGAGHRAFCLRPLLKYL